MCKPHAANHSEDIDVILPILPVSTLQGGAIPSHRPLLSASISHKSLRCTLHSGEGAWARAVWLREGMYQQADGRELCVQDFGQGTLENPVSHQSFFSFSVYVVNRLDLLISMDI